MIKDYNQDIPKEDRRNLKGLFTKQQNSFMLILSATVLPKGLTGELPMLYIGVMTLFASAVFYYSVNSRKKNPPVIGDDGYTIRLVDFSWKRLKANKNR